ncbi:MAG: hypothetical protein LBD23_11345, partial [Oscillospiraceae bacterium]|nr:hypothetical protein [Oscillospiraceae bacterium]
QPIAKWNKQIRCEIRHYSILTQTFECAAYDQVVSHIAHQQIDLDLDDGVKVNYEKFQGVKVPIDGGKSVTMDLLGRI